MKLRSAIPLAAAFGLSACNAGALPPAKTPSAPTAEVQGVRDGQTTLAAGQTLTIALPSNATTGYRWQIDGFDAGILTPGAPFGDEIADPHAPGMVGVGGRTLWRFQAARSGTATLRFAYGRAWERDRPPAETATYNVTVR